MLPLLLVTLSLLVLSPFHTSARAVASRASTCSYSLFGITASGKKTDDGACRWTLRYGRAARWEPSAIAWDASNQTFANLPPSCPQSAGGYTAGSSQSEDCLFATVYMPQGSAPQGGWPVFVWLHGGSFIEGSASAPGLDGSKLAVRGEMIVVVLQYRLGVLGFLPPTLSSSSTDPNLGLNDVVLGLKIINQGVEYVGGNRGKITVGGQSSGAGLVRALWGTPAASGLFRAAILQSDPMSYGFASSAITAQIQKAFYSQSPMSACKTLDCLKKISTSALVAAQDTLVQTVIYTVPGVPFTEPLRPTFNTTTLPHDPTTSLFNDPSLLTFPPALLPLLISTVKNEGGSAVQSIFPSNVPLDNDTYYATAAALIGADRAAALVSSKAYALSTAATGNSSDKAVQYGASGDAFRETFEKAVTDGTWRCPNRDAAGRWHAVGGKVWVAEWRQGVSYVDNEAMGGYCKKDGVVCHEDDLYPTFSTAPSPSSNVSVFEDEILARWASFITTLDPNPPTSKRACPTTATTTSSPTTTSTKSTHTLAPAAPFAWWKWKRAAVAAGTTVKQWSEYTSQGDVYALGGDGEVETCPDGYWGKVSPYDFTLYG
ncbi:hypothetical protein IAT38_000888 [Cryptococcus sp. DSM 104549]